MIKPSEKKTPAERFEDAWRAWAQRPPRQPLADSTVVVARGGRAVVGGMNGATAPYIFVFVEPEAPATGAAGAKTAVLPPGITEPKPVYTVPPKYPEEAKKEKISGPVELEATIGADGSVVDAKAVKSADPRLSEAAINAVKQWKFKPARTKEGKAVKVVTTITVNFKLH